ncbi:hypothetical protein [Psychromonas sp. SP041]|uniref:hypothetical protein n=1 Tax=Psychromonas sp. SP041 TaxID=1365007 RepID=UPI0010C7C5E7|nr:hypothetical protein [Psychromonas sp. SP041]
MRCKKVVENQWNSLTFVFDVNEGHMANSGFLYNEDSIRPASARIEDEPMALNNKIRAFQTVIFQKYGHRFKRLLVQIEKNTGRIKIDFEFDNAHRWTIFPSKIAKMREELRPNFN